MYFESMFIIVTGVKKKKKKNYNPEVSKAPYPPHSTPQYAFPCTKATSLQVSRIKFSLLHLQIH